MSSLLVYKPANLFIIVSKYFFPIPLLKISSVTISADVFLYQPEFPWLNSSNIYLLTLLNADTFSFASHLSPAILHSGLNSFPLFQFRFIIFQVHKKSLIAFITHAAKRGKYLCCFSRVSDTPSSRNAKICRTISEK